MFQKKLLQASIVDTFQPKVIGWNTSTSVVDVVIHQQYLLIESQQHLMVMVDALTARFQQLPFMYYVSFALMKVLDGHKARCNLRSHILV